MGYRWYDAHNVTPAYPFGHGLSYTSFEYSDIKVVDRTITCSIKNTGQVFGKEIAQLYVGFPSQSGEPPKLLKGFTKLSLKPGETQVASFKLRDRDLSIWNVDVHNQELQSGQFEVYIGASNRDIRL